MFDSAITGFRSPRDATIHEHVLREVLEIARRMDLHQSPPAMAQQFHRRIRELTGERDPFRNAKNWSNRLAMDQYPELQDWVRRSLNPLETAIRLAIAGNVIDLGANSGLTESQVYHAVRHAMSTPLEGSVEEFSDAVSGANRILYLADNAGEIVFDRLLIEQLPAGKVTLAVKGAPVSNDATMSDAEDTGITELVEVIENGSDAPGTVLDDCSKEFRECFDRAELVIAKGQGNYESLSEVQKDIYFALRVKCPVIARHLGYQEGCLILRRSDTASVRVAPVGKLVQT